MKSNKSKLIFNIGAIGMLGLFIVFVVLCYTTEDLKGGLI